MRMLNFDIHHTLVVIDVRSLLRCDNLSCGIGYLQFNSTAFIVGCRREVNLSLKACLIGIGRLLMQDDAVATVEERRYAGTLSRFLQPHITVDATVDVEVARNGGNVKLVAVVANHGNRVLLAIFHLIGYLHGESGEGIAVFTYLLIVTEHVGSLAYTFEMNEDAATLVGFRYHYLLFIRAFALAEAFV